MPSVNYIAKCPHGNILAAINVREGNEKETAKVVGKWILQGLSVEQSTSETVRVSVWGCEECKKAK